MSFSGFGMVSQLPSTLPVPGDYDYLLGGVGLSELQRVATQIAALLISGKAWTVQAIRANAADQGSLISVPTNQVIAAIWNGHTNSANMLALTIVNTMVAEQARNPVALSRKTTSMLGKDLPGRVTATFLNGGDPSACMMNFENGMQSWQSVSSSMPGHTPTGWCERQFIISGLPCQPFATCKQTLTPSGAMTDVSAPPPAPGTPTAPPTAATYTPQPPPTHAQVDAQVAAALQANGQSFAQLEAKQQQAEFATYLGALAQARQWLTLGLRIPTDAPDAELWSALIARDIQPQEALDWFTGCDDDLDCFRQKMNLALGEADARARDDRAKVAVGVLAIGAVALTAYVLRGARR